MSFYTDDCKTGVEAIERARSVRRYFASLRAPIPPPPPVVEALPPPEPAPISPPPIEIAPITESPEEPEAAITVRRIIHETAEYFGFTYAHLVGERRSAPIVRARQVAMYIAHGVVLNSTYPMIGRAFRRDHTTILHGVRRIKVLLGAGRGDIVMAVGAIMEKFGLPMPDEAPCSELLRLHWTKWSKAELKALREMYEVEALPVEDIATKLHRTIWAVTTKLFKLGYRRTKAKAA